MRALFIYILLSIGFVSTTNACDICGCSANSHSLGVTPMFAKHFVGFRYFYRHFHSAHPSLNSESQMQSDEYFHSADVWVRYNPHKRVQLFAFLPFNAYLQNKKDAESSKNIGFGDMMLLANVSIFNNTDSLDRPWRHALQGGVGIKLPTGQWQKQADNTGINANLQLGSGSFDVPFNLSYTLRHRRHWGWQTEATYKLNTANAAGFRFGNQLTVSQQVFYSRTVARWNFMPSLGITYFNSQNNREHKEDVFQSGGNLLFANVSMQIFFKRVMLGVSVRQPLWQGMADGYTRASTQLQASFVVFI